MPQDPQTRRLVDAVWAAWQALFEYDARAGLATVYAMSNAAIRAPVRRAARAARILAQAKALCYKCKATLGPWDAYCPGCAAPNYRRWTMKAGQIEPPDPPWPQRREQRGRRDL